MASRGTDKKLKSLRKSVDELQSKKKWAEMNEKVEEILRMIRICDNCGQSRMHHLNETKCLFNSTSFKASH